MEKFVVVVVALGIESGEPADVQRMVPCADEAAVASAIRAVDPEDETWALYETTGGRYVRRSVIFQTGGGCTVQ